MNFGRQVVGLETPVPMLDVTRQNDLLRAEIEAAIAEVCRSGAFVHGPACARFEKAMADYCGSEHAIGCASGSDALLLALMVLGIGPGDEVILPSFTFFATAGAVWRLGAKPVFADILPATFNIDPADVERKITNATKAIMPVHLFGQCAEMDRLTAIADAAGAAVIEDAAQAIGAEWRGRRAGSIGALGAFSFYPTKNLGGFGDGGLITTNDDELAGKLRVLRDHGQQPRYYHHFVGINSRLDAIQAAVLGVKLPRLTKWAQQRERHASRYASEFTRRGLAKQIVAPKVVDGCFSVWNQYTVRVGGGQRDALQKHLAERQIGSAVYYPVPLHLQTCFAALGCRAGSLPVTEQACREVLSLPVYPELTAAEQNAVIDAVAGFCQGHARAVA
jgi:dTDP-4-amino-4,6-dideoxygalactose transaminase